MCEELDITGDESTKDATLQKIKSLKNGKAPDIDGIPAESIKIHPELSTVILYELLKNI